MLRNLLIGLFAFVALLLGYIAFQPGDFRVARSAVIPAGSQTVFGHISDLRKWPAWSPWARMDPNVKLTFKGPEKGKGSAMHWDGNKDVGAGTMTMLEARASDLVRIRIDIEKPMAASNEAVFTLKPEGAGTRVDWVMTGNNNFLGRLFSLFFSMDKVVGGQFEQGFANLTEVVKK